MVFVDKMKKIENVFLQDPQFKCFGCAHKNDLGLHLEFFEDEETEEVFTVTTIKDSFVSFNGIAHGGTL